MLELLSQNQARLIFNSWSRASTSIWMCSEGPASRLASCFQRRRLPQDVSKLLPLNPICASNSDDSIYATSTTYRKRSTPVTSTSNLLMPCQSCFSIEECYKRNTLWSVGGPVTEYTRGSLSGKEGNTDRWTSLTPSHKLQVHDVEMLSRLFLRTLRLRVKIGARWLRVFLEGAHDR
jgi:hypothetical protein